MTNDLGSSPPHIMLVESRYYPDIADELVRGAVATLEEAGATYKRYSVPGVFEIPAAIRYAIRAVEIFPSRKRFDGYLALGCLIRGETSRYDLISTECSRGLQNLVLEFSIALGYGVMAVETREEAWQRVKLDEGNRGGEAARTCLEMVRLKTDFKLFPRLS